MKHLRVAALWLILKVPGLPESLQLWLFRFAITGSPWSKVEFDYYEYKDHSERA